MGVGFQRHSPIDAGGRTAARDDARALFLDILLLTSP